MAVGIKLLAVDIWCYFVYNWHRMPKQEGLFRVSGNNWGLACPFEPIVCRRGYCDFCEIYHDWQKLGEIVVICAWCSKVIDKKPGLGKPVVSHGICRECVQKYFPETTSRDTKSRRIKERERWNPRIALGLLASWNWTRGFLSYIRGDTGACLS